MVLAVGKFQVSKYAAPGGGGQGGQLDFGLGTVGGNQFGGGGIGQLIPSNVYPTLIGPGGEVMPGGGGTPLPGGVGLENPAYADHPGRFWDPTSNGGVYGTDVFREGGGRGGPAKTFGSRILNVNLPKMISAGQPFAIIVTYIHQGDAFTTYKIKCNIPILQIMETSQEKRVANGGQDNIVINLTAPSPLPNGVITGTVELVQTEGNEITVDSEIITIPSEVVPNPPVPAPTPDPTPVPGMPPGPGTPGSPGSPGTPLPEPSPPPTAPPAPPVPIPPVLQLIPVIITRGEEGGQATIVIEASNLEASEPCSLFVYLSHRPGGQYGWGSGGRWRAGDRGDRPDRPDRSREDWDKDFDVEKWIAKQTPAGSVAAANIAYSYPASVSINGITSAGNGLRLTSTPVRPQIQNISRLPPPTNPIIQNLVQARIQERLNLVQSGRVDAAIQQMTITNPARANELRQEIEARVQEKIAEIVGAAGGAGAVASSSSPHQLPIPPVRPVFKRQRISLTATEAGTIRHVVRVQSAPVTAKLHGFVLVYGHRSKRHSGRKPFSL